MSKDLILNIMLKAADKASASFAKVRAAADGLSGNLAKLQHELRQTERIQKHLKERTGLTAKIRETSKAMVENRREQIRLNAEIAKSGVPTQKQAAALKKLKETGEALLNTRGRQIQKLETLNQKLKQHGITAKNAAAVQLQLQQKTADTTHRIERQTAALERLEKARNLRSKAAVYAGVAGAAAHTAKAALTPAVMAAVGEEDAMMGVIRQVNSLKHADGRLNFAEIEKMRQEVYELSRQLPMSTVEILNMYAAGAKMNVPRKELAGYVSEAVKAANAFEAADPGKLAEELGRVRANFKLSKEAASELVNVMNYLDDNALVSGDQLISYMNQVSGSMGLAKMNVKHVAALGSALISAGAEEGTAAKAVGSLMTRLGTAPDLKPVREALKDIGLDAHAVQKGIVTDAQATLEQIINAVKKMPKEEQAGILKGLAGGEYNRVFAGLVANTELWAEQLRLATSPEALGSLDAEFAVRVQSMSAKWQMFQNRLFNTESGLGRGLFDILEWGMDIVGKGLDKISAWTAAHPQLAGNIMKAVAVFTAFAAVVSAVILPLASLKFALTYLGVSGISWVLKLGGTFISVGGTFISVGGKIISILRSVALVAMANPIGVVIAAIVAALVLLYFNWDKVKNALINGWQWIKKVFRDNPLLAAFTGPIGAIAGLIANFDRLKAAAKTAWDWVKRAVSGGSSAAPAAVGVPAKGFSVGGYTGSGGVNQAAGIVHKGEVVFSQRDVARFGGWRAVEALRLGGLNALQWMYGKFDGVKNVLSGLMPSETPQGVPKLVGAVPVPAGFNRSGGGAQTTHTPFNVSITINGGSQSAAEIAREVQKQLEHFARQTARRARSSFFDKD